MGYPATSGLPLIAQRISLCCATGLRRRRIGTQPAHRKLLIRMTSLLTLPRVSASCLPSRDQSKSKISPDSNFVICFGGPPVSFCCQMLDTPLLVSTNSTASPSGAQRGALAAAGKSDWNPGAPPSKGITFS